MVVEGCGGAHLTHQTVAVTKKQRGLVSRIAISVKLEKASVRSPFTTCTGLQHVRNAQGGPATSAHRSFCAR